MPVVIEWLYMCAGGFQNNSAAILISVFETSNEDFVHSGLRKGCRHYKTRYRAIPNILSLIPHCFCWYHYYIVFVHFIPFNQLILTLIFWVLSTTTTTTIYFSIPTWVHGVTKNIIQLKWCNYDISIWHWYTSEVPDANESDSYWCASMYIMEEFFLGNCMSKMNGK